jgi:ABC-2 type transport system ATP-binding protein
MVEGMETVVEFERLEKVYRPGLFRRPVCALRGLDLGVRRGQIHGLIGRNGAGKTTAFKILLGLLRPSGGGGRLLGRPLGDREARRRLGFLPEAPAYYAHLRAGELLDFARALSGAGRDRAADRRLLEELGLEGLESRPLRKLSKGQLQRLGLAQALVHRPELLILDEPMSGLDPLGRAAVKRRLRAERESGRTILLSSHLLGDVEALCDTVSLIADGRLVVEGSPAELLEGTAAAVVIEGQGPLPREPLRGAPAGSTLARGDEGWTVRLANPAGDELDRCLRNLMSEGGRVQRVEAEREDLESFFLRLSSGAERTCAA